MDTLIDLVRQETNLYVKQQMVETLSREPSVALAVARYVGWNGMQEMLSNFPDSTRKSLERSWFVGQSGVQAWLGTVDWRKFVDFTDGYSERDTKQVVEGLINSDGMVFTYDSAFQLFNRLVKRLDAHDAKSQCGRLVMRPNIVKYAVRNGHVESLIDVSKRTFDPLRSNEFILFSPVGIVADAIKREAFDIAEDKLLAYADHEKGWARLGAFYDQQGILNERIEQLSKTIEMQTDATKKTASQQRLAFLLRCDGRFIEAIQVARAAGDDRLAKRIAAGGHVWKDAADLHQQLYDSSNKNFVLLGTLIAYYKLADNQQAFQEYVDLCMQQHVSQSKLGIGTVRGLIATLILTGEVEKAVELAKANDPSYHFQLLWGLGKHDEALGQIDYDKNAPSAWIERFDVPSQFTIPSMYRMRFGLIVSDALLSVGRRAEAIAIQDELLTFPNLEANNFRIDLTRSILKAGRTQKAIELSIGDETQRFNSNGYLFHLHTALDKERFVGEELGWWRLLVSREQAKSSQPGTRINPYAQLDRQKFIQIATQVTDLLLHRQFKLDDGETIDLVRFIEQEAGKTYARPFLTIVASTLVRINDRQRARELLRQANFTPWQILQTCGPPEPTSTTVDNERDSSKPEGSDPDALAEVKNDVLLDNAKLYEEAWNTEPLRLEYLMLSGASLVEAGRTDEGRKRMRQASLLAIDVDDRVELAKKLQDVGRNDLAVQQFAILKKTAVTDSEVWHRACHELAKCESDPELQRKNMIDYALLYAWPRWQLEDPAGYLPLQFDIK
ncbi:MAG: hypothetical protein R3C05_02720 [Pirellulaceae bacterium]